MFSAVSFVRVFPNVFLGLFISVLLLCKCVPFLPILFLKVPFSSLKIESEGTKGVLENGIRS